MSNTQRAKGPQRVRTPKDEQTREAALDAQAFGVRVAGVDYWLNPADISGLVEMKVRRETGMSIGEIAAKADGSMGVDILGCLMYACEIAAGRDADLEQILGSISYASEVEVIDEPGDPVPQP